MRRKMGVEEWGEFPRSSPSLAVSPMMRVVVAVAKLIGAVMVGIMMVEVVKSEIMAATHHDEQYKAT
jgi:hypothetical protein